MSEENAESLRETLSASFDKIEKAEGTDVPSGVPSPDSGLPSSASADGAAPSAPPPPLYGEPQQQPPQPAPQAPKPPGNVPASQQPLPELRAPNAWRAEVREQWKDVPAAVQSEILRREREIRLSMQESAEARKQAEAYTKVAAPYQHYIALEGGDPVAAFGDYLKTVSVLRGGTPYEKAWGLASVVQKFGVDVGALDQALTQMMSSGQMGRAPQQQQQHAGGEYRDPRVDTLLAQMQAQESAREQALDRQAGDDVDAFYNDAANEFIADVKNDMADILDLYANQGRKITLKEAYDRACALHPEISKVVEQRKIATAAQQQSGATAARRRAAGSISDSSGASTGAANGKLPNVREAIVAAMNQQV